MEITKISSKGQIVIPSKIREALGIYEGSVLAIEKVNDMVMIKKIDTELLEQFKRGLEDLRAGRVRRVA
jgi:AbrB family looped-hinge helix DNA binding protein